MVLAIPRMDVALPRRRVAHSGDIGPLARVLRRLRAERGWSQDDVATRAQMRQPYYSSLETGSILNPSDQKLSALDEAFELEPGTLRRMMRDDVTWNPAAPALAGDNPLMEVLAPGPNGEFVALVRRVPASRQREAAEIIRRQVTEMLKVLAEDTPQS